MINPKRIKEEEERNHYRNTDCCTKEDPKRLSQNEEDAQEIARAIKKAARGVKNIPIPPRVETFFTGEDVSPRTRNIKRLAEAGAKVPPKRRRTRRNVAAVK